VQYISGVKEHEKGLPDWSDEHPDWLDGNLIDSMARWSHSSSLVVGWCTGGPVDGMEKFPILFLIPGLD
jgi:hypothetical protein